MIRNIALRPTVRLFARFAIAGLIGLVIIAGLLFYAWMTAFERHEIKETQTNMAKYVNTMVSHMLTRQDFESIITGDDWETFKTKVADRQEMRRASQGRNASEQRLRAGLQIYRHFAPRFTGIAGGSPSRVRCSAQSRRVWILT